jgi:hypothetical protein
VGTDLTRIGQKARKEPDLVFTSLYHHIYDVDNLRACYDTLEANKATGVDGVTKEEYGKTLKRTFGSCRESSGGWDIGRGRNDAATYRSRAVPRAGRWA